MENNSKIRREQALCFSLLLMVIGVLMAFNNAVSSIEWVVRDVVMTHVHRQYTFDNVLQYLPAFLFLVLPGKHSFGKKVLLLILCIALMEAVTQPIKYLTAVLRPDGSTFNSFPSGHTGMVCVGATLLALECKRWKMPYVGASIAVCIGCMRMINNRHWLSDVLFGAGLGIFVVLLIWMLWERRERHLAE